MHAENIIQLAENPATLLAAWQQLQNEHKGPMPLRARDAANQLGVSEAQLLASRCGDDVIRLNNEWTDMILKMPELGRVMSLVRNDYAVHEKKGEYGHINFEGPQGKIGVVANEAIDLRIFLYRWHVAFAVVDEVRNKAETQKIAAELGMNPNDTRLIAAADTGNKRFSLQFFDKQGNSIQKIYLLAEGGNKEAYDNFVKQFTAADQSPEQILEPAAAAPVAKPDAEIDAEALRQEWSALKDTHDFYMMLRKYGVERMQALRLGGSALAEPVALTSVREVLETASATALPIMVFVGNDNILQIHTGKVVRIKPIHGWLNVMDPDFNLHLREEAIAYAWVVRKPTVDGMVTALELYDKKEHLIATFFGKRKPGIPEDLTWRALAESLVS